MLSLSPRLNYEVIFEQPLTVQLQYIQRSHRVLKHALACLQPSLISGSGKLLSHPIQTIGEVCRQQGQKLIEELILLAHDQLQQGQSATDVFSRLFAKQRKEVTA